MGLLSASSIEAGKGAKCSLPFAAMEAIGLGAQPMGCRKTSERISRDNDSLLTLMLLLANLANKK